MKSYKKEFEQKLHYEFTYQISSSVSHQFKNDEEIVLINFVDEKEAELFE